KENVLEVTPRMGGEDFAYYAQKIPACFYRLGTGNAEKGITSNIHTPTFNIDEDALPVGMGMMAWHAVEELVLG
ncbi:MAG: M20/M25/M40 family metallo-hydrolase, partial [Chitinophagales bacterium]